MTVVVVLPTVVEVVVVQMPLLHDACEPVVVVVVVGVLLVGLLIVVVVVLEVDEVTELHETNIATPFTVPGHLPSGGASTPGTELGSMGGGAKVLVPATGELGELATGFTFGSQVAPV
jgi:hypothetical protein